MDHLSKELKEWKYESAVETVEDIIKNIESGDMELAAIFDQFAIAVEHLQACETFLKHHRQQVDLLVETLTDEANF
ncbi:MAG: exodeoxyribonuclease VII small subunit [Cyanobacteria bacterium P01_F01_bin.150]